MSEDTKAPETGELTTSAVDGDLLPPLEPVSIFDLCETDDDLSENGKWFHDVYAPGISVKLRRFTSRKSINVRNVLMKKYQRYAKKGEYPPEIDERMLIEQLSEAIIVDWKGMPGRNGKDITYSKTAAVELCKMLDFRVPLIQLAGSADAFKAENEKAVEGN